MSKVYLKLMKVQKELKAPKGQFNKFGNYKYRSCEEILEGVKPLLSENKAIILLNDEIVLIGDRYYIKATATFVDAETGDKVEVSAKAREAENKKGMDASQVTGATSSYARKYALNGLLCIDDTKDADTQDNSASSNKNNKSSNSNPKSISDAQLKRLYAIAYSKGIDRDTVKSHASKKFGISVDELNKAQYDTMCAGYENMESK